MYSKYSRPIVSTPNAQASPPRPCSLPISEPKPIPTAGPRRFSRPQTPPKVFTKKILNTICFLINTCCRLNQMPFHDHNRSV